MAETANQLSKLSIQEEDEWKVKYDNTHHYAGYAVIICNIDFIDPTSDRDGAKKDVINLQEVLKKKGFFVKEPLYNQSIAETKQVLENARNAPELLKSDCFLLVISSHGGYSSRDGPDGKQMIDTFADFFLQPAQVSDLLSVFSSKESPHIKEKPKLFLMQFCRGESDQHTGQIVKDGNKVVRGEGAPGFPFGVPQNVAMPHDKDVAYILPTHHNFFLHYATTPGHVSFRNPFGTPFLGAWRRTLASDTTQNVDLLSMATQVNKQVSNEDINDNGLVFKQMPQFVSMLKKDFVFRK